MSVWKGFKEFIVSDKVAENEYIYSFYLTSIDDERLPDYYRDSLLLFVCKMKIELGQDQDNIRYQVFRMVNILKLVLKESLKVM